MRNWSEALDLAFTTTLKKAGNQGTVGNQRKKSHENNDPTDTKIIASGYHAKIGGNPAELGFGNCKGLSNRGDLSTVTKVTEDATAFFNGDFEERAAVIEEGASVPREWAEGFAALCTMEAPEGFGQTRWFQMIDDAGRFLDAWGNVTARLGWKAADVFGVHPDAPSTRVGMLGLAPLLNGGEVIAIEADAATIRYPSGVVRKYRRIAGRGTACLWDIEPNPFI